MSGQKVVSVHITTPLYDPAAVRAYARSQGHVVGERGRLRTSDVANWLLHEPVTLSKIARQFGFLTEGKRLPRDGSPKREALALEIAKTLK